MAGVGGIAGIWTSESEVLKATKKIRDMGFEKMDVITPYPVHGMEEALKIKRSNIPYVTFIAGIIGFSFALWLTWWTSTQSWAINVGGKPFFSLPAFIPIMFELTILFAALSSVATLFVFAGLPKLNPPIIDPDLTCHKFAIFVPKNDKGYDEGKLEQLYKELGAVDIKKMAEY